MNILNRWKAAVRAFYSTNKPSENIQEQLISNLATCVNQIEIACELGTFTLEQKAAAVAASMRVQIAMSASVTDMWQHFADERNPQ